MSSDDVDIREAIRACAQAGAYQLGNQLALENDLLVCLQCGEDFYSWPTTEVTIIGPGPSLSLSELGVDSWGKVHIGCANKVVRLRIGWSATNLQYPPGRGRPISTECSYEEGLARRYQRAIENMIKNRKKIWETRLLTDEEHEAQAVK